MKLEIKKFRRLNKLTQKQLAEMTGLSQSYISQLESNKSYKAPTMATVLSLAKALGVCPTILINYDCDNCNIKNVDRVKCKYLLRSELGNRFYLLSNKKRG